MLTVVGGRIRHEFFFSYSCNFVLLLKYLYKNENTVKQIFFLSCHVELTNVSPKNQTVIFFKGKQTISSYYKNTRYDLSNKECNNP